MRTLTRIKTRGGGGGGCKKKKKKKKKKKTLHWEFKKGKTQRPIFELEKTEHADYPESLERVFPPESRLKIRRKRKASVLPELL